MRTLNARTQRDANALIRALSTVAGNEDRVLAILEHHASEHGIDATKQLAAAALAVVFAECVTQPVSLDRQTPHPLQTPPKDK